MCSIIWISQVFILKCFRARHLHFACSEGLIIVNFWEVCNWHPLMKCFQKLWLNCLKLQLKSGVEVEQWSIHVFILGRFAKHDETDMMMIINSNYFVKFGKKPNNSLNFPSIEPQSAIRKLQAQRLPDMKIPPKLLLSLLAQTQCSKWMQVSTVFQVSGFTSELSWAPTTREVFWRRSTSAEVKSNIKMV